MRTFFVIVHFLCAVAMVGQSYNSSDFEKELNDAVLSLYCKNELDSALSKLQQIEEKHLFFINTISPQEYVLTALYLSDVYTKKNDLKKSEQIVERAEQYLLECGNQFSSLRRYLLMQEGLNNLIIENAQQGKDLLLQSKSLFEKESDNWSVEYAMCLTRLAIAYQKTGEFFLSNIFLDVSLNVFKKLAPILGHELFDDSRFLTMMNVYTYNVEYMGENKYANDIRNEIRRRNGSSPIVDDYMKKDNRYLEMIEKLYFSGDNGVEDVLKEYVDYVKSNLLTVLSTFSESERENYWSKQSLSMMLIVNAVAWKKKTPKLLKLSYNTTLYTKSLLSRFSKIISDYAKDKSSNAIRDDYKELLMLKKSMIKKGLSEDSVVVLNNRLNEVERSILSSVDNCTDLYNDSMFTCDEIRKYLKPGDVAIEYVLFPELQPNGEEGASYYGALIERSGFSHPLFVKLCDYNLFGEILNKDNISEDAFISKLYGFDNEMLYKLIFEPLEKYLHGCKTVYFSPVGDLHKINLQAIAVKGQRLMDKYVLEEVSSTVKIIEYSNSKEINHDMEAFLIGGVDYNESSVQTNIGRSDSLKLSYGHDIATKSGHRGAWDLIPSAFYEVQQIDSILKENNIKTVLLTGNRATEESFKDLDGKSSGIIHIATHGFFYKNPNQMATHYFDKTNSYSVKNLPMKYSGLLLAGSNNTWVGNEIGNLEDGVLSAEEISQMDLSETKIVILSACETGLGEVDNVDGVYGLQRGFKMAGVETIVMSLWKVSDEATKILMVEFYRNWMAGKTKQQSLHEAQQYLRKVDNGKYDDPKYWASFIMLDGLN